MCYFLRKGFSETKKKHVLIYVMPICEGPSKNSQLLRFLQFFMGKVPDLAYIFDLEIHLHMLTLHQCCIPKDMGHHGSSVFSPACHMQQSYLSRSASNSLCQAIQKINHWSLFSPSAIQISCHAIALHLLASHYKANKPQLTSPNHSHPILLSSRLIRNFPFNISSASFYKKTALRSFNLPGPSPAPIRQGRQNICLNEYFCAG